MRPLKLKDWILIGVLAFGLGLSSPYISGWLSGAPVAAAPDAPPQDTEPIASNPFTLKLLKAATLVQPEGNIILAPDSLASTLQQMLPIAAPEVEKALTDLGLPAEPQVSSAPFRDAVCLFADPAVGLHTETEQLYIAEAPFTQNPPQAFSTINLELQSLLGREIGTPANGETINSNTNLLAFNGINIQLNWYCPISARNTTPAIFYNANGSAPLVHFMSAYTQHYAEDPQGAWKAAAIRLDRSPRAMRNTPDCYLLLLQPCRESNAHTMAAELTPEQFSAIRTALRESSRSCTTRLPRLSFTGNVHSTIPLLKALGIDPLFTSAAPFAKLTDKTPWPFTTAWQYCRIVMKESPEAAVERRQAPETAESVDCNRPFIWFIMPLSSPHAPYAMGIVENL